MSPYVDRTLAATIRHVSASFPALLLTGPRQVGKTTLLEACAEPGRGYVSLDETDIPLSAAVAAIPVWYL